MNKRILYLDGLRGVLAIIVFVHHFLYAFCPDLIFGGNFELYRSSGPFSFYKIMALTPINILFNPGMAIHFFFLLSGYVQTQAYFLKPDITFLQKSILKRYFRLAIPVLAVLLLVYACHRLGLITKHLIPYNELSNNWVQSMLPNTLQFTGVIREALSHCFRGNSRYYQILWTMPTELLNSYLILFVLLGLHQLQHKNKILLALMLIQFFVLEAYYSVGFVAGMVLANLHTNSEKFKQFFSRGWVKASCLLLGLYFGSYPFTGYQNAAAHSVYAPISFFEVYPHIISYLIGVSFLFCFLLYSKNVQSLLSKTFFLLLGKISFFFYLVHFILLFTFSPWLYRQLMDIHDGGVDLLITGFLSFVIIAAVSWILTQLIDAPLIRLCKRGVTYFFIKREENSLS